MDDKIKFIVNKKKSPSYKLATSELDYEYLVDIEMSKSFPADGSGKDFRSGRIALSYNDIKFVEFSAYGDNIDQIMLETWERLVFIHGYGLKTIYSALLDKKLKSLDLSDMQDVASLTELDVVITKIFYEFKQPEVYMPQTGTQVAAADQTPPAQNNAAAAKTGLWLKLKKLISG